MNNPALLNQFLNTQNTQNGHNAQNTQNTINTQTAINSQNTQPAINSQNSQTAINSQNTLNAQMLNIAQLQQFQFNQMIPNSIHNNIPNNSIQNNIHHSTPMTAAHLQQFAFQPHLQQQLTISQQNQLNQITKAQQLSQMKANMNQMGLMNPLQIAQFQQSLLQNQASQNQGMTQAQMIQNAMNAAQLSQNNPQNNAQSFMRTAQNSIQSTPSQSINLNSVPNQNNSPSLVRTPNQNTQAQQSNSSQPSPSNYQEAMKKVQDNIQIISQMINQMGKALQGQAPPQFMAQISQLLSKNGLNPDNQDDVARFLGHQIQKLTEKKLAFQQVMQQYMLAYQKINEKNMMRATPQNSPKLTREVFDSKYSEFLKKNGHGDYQPLKTQKVAGAPLDLYNLFVLVTMDRKWKYVSEQMELNNASSALKKNYKVYHLHLLECEVYPGLMDIMKRRTSAGYPVSAGTPLGMIPGQQIVNPQMVQQVGQQMMRPPMQYGNPANFGVNSWGRPMQPININQMYRPQYRPGFQNVPQSAPPKKTDVPPIPNLPLTAKVSGDGELIKSPVFNEAPLIPQSRPKKKLSRADLGPVDMYKIYMSLRSGQQIQVIHALNVLLVLSNEKEVYVRLDQGLIGEILLAMIRLPRDKYIPMKTLIESVKRLDSHTPKHPEIECVLLILRNLTMQSLDNTNWLINQNCTEQLLDLVSSNIPPIELLSIRKLCFAILNHMGVGVRIHSAAYIEFVHDLVELNLPRFRSTNYSSRSKPVSIIGQDLQLSNVLESFCKVAIIVENMDVMSRLDCLSILENLIILYTVDVTDARVEDLVLWEFVANAAYHLIVLLALMRENSDQYLRILSRLIPKCIENCRGYENIQFNMLSLRAGRILVEIARYEVTRGLLMKYEEAILGIVCKAKLDDVCRFLEEALHFLNFE